MKIKLRTTAVFFIIGATVPYLLFAFGGRLVGPFLSALLLLLSLILLIISAIRLTITETGNGYRFYYLPVAIGAIVLFWYSLGLLAHISDFIYFKLNESALNKMVSDIKSYGKIEKMSDGQRFWKILNGTAYEFNSKDTVREFETSPKKYLLNEALAREGVDRQHFEAIRQGLIETEYMSFAILPDGTISFTEDGLIDNCYGIAYSETGTMPVYNDCGELIRWVKISGNWYAWGTT
ncbi:hypothetical protein M0L20_12140 [Spirosoma sp. RP8]|uniref:Uncharacterized protein n=1 Tax=Spirosoma liriopis TaxID=2937440 RepID=A0ABT0HL66_9BACT|nr:hypothetical protein [Spirosoma liriopis]MCK8492607.1 hypothetical protein [Spirosoma liriopis]